METFPIVKSSDLSKYGTYRTKDLVLDVYDGMVAADAVLLPYATPISPPPGHGPRHAAQR